MRLEAPDGILPGTGVVGVVQMNHQPLGGDQYLCSGDGREGKVWPTGESSLTPQGTDRTDRETGVRRTLMGQLSLDILTD